jgi:predicted aspartyl protease
VIFTFPYRHQPDVEPSPVAPDVPVFRPKIPLRLAGPHGNQWLTYALVDTGADETVVPLEAARTLRVDLNSKIPILRAADNKVIQVRYGIVELSLGNGAEGYTWTSMVAFQKGRPYSVLGRAGCLDRLDVRFDGPNRRVIITTPTP